MSEESSVVTRRGSALILVDVQPDFCPGGALAVRHGDGILDPITRLIARNLFEIHVATQDWHPEGHASFASSHPGRRPMEVIELHGHDQVLWPDHCVQGTPGAALHPGLDWRMLSAVIRKGMDPMSDSYSGIRNNWNAAGARPSTGLAGYLRDRAIDRVYVCGLARDYCVRWTAEDAAAEGFETTVLWDLTRSVDPTGDGDLRAALAAQGIRLVTSDTLQPASTAAERSPGPGGF